MDGVEAAKSDYDFLKGYICRFNGIPSRLVDGVIRFLQSRYLVEKSIEKEKFDFLEELETSQNCRE